MTVKLTSSHNYLSDLARTIFDQLICSNLESKHGIKTTTDRAMGNAMEINVERRAVLRQYFGKEYNNIKSDIMEGNVRRATYAVGCGSLSVGTDPHNYVTREMTDEMNCLGVHLQNLLRSNVSLLKLEDVNLERDFNHCTALFYYADEAIKESCTLGFHCDCTYSAKTKLYETSKNSQVENTPVVSYSIGSERKMKWMRRKSKAKGNHKYATWEKDKSWPEVTYKVGDGSMSLFNPKDEDPCSKKNKSKSVQYQHGDVVMTGSNMALVLVFRVVNRIQMYSKATDKMIVTTNIARRDVSGLYKKFNGDQFMKNLRSLYYKKIFK